VDRPKVRPASKIWALPRSWPTRNDPEVPADKPGIRAANERRARGFKN
jgi:hypothetical protein